MVAPVPLVGRADAGAQGAPSEVVEHPMTAMIPLSTVRQMGLPIVLVAPTAAGATQPVMTPPTQVEVAAAVIDGSQPGATEAALLAPA